MTFPSLLRAALLMTPVLGFCRSPALSGNVPPPLSRSGRPWTRPYRSNTPCYLLLRAQPKRGSVVDGYQTVSVNCSKCGTRLFRYKKKNGTKSNLVKLYVERIVEDCTGLLKEEDEENVSQQQEQQQQRQKSWYCPNCQQNFARSAVIHGRPALKLVGGKVRMTKK